MVHGGIAGVYSLTIMFRRAVDDIQQSARLTGRSLPSVRCLSGIALAAALVWPAFGEDAETRDHAWWAFQPLTKPAVPETPVDHWSVNVIDRFAYARMRDAGIEPAPRATDSELLRRVYFDLVGMPPTPAEIDAFMNDSSADPWGSLIDRLLDDRRYGEHWARFWLDLVRYAESDGWNKDSYRANIWRYRDYVVNAFNADKPYPDFVREQLAGDEIGEDNPEDLIATGFLRLGIYEYNQRDAKPHWNDIMNEMTDVTGDVFLGLSMSCSRCHDHKFDAIPQIDYFGLRAFLEPVIWRDDIPGATEEEQAAWREQQANWEEATADIRAEIDAFTAPFIKKKWDATVDKFPIDIQACFNKPVDERTSWEHQMAYLVERQFYEEGEPWQKSLSKEDKAKHEELLKRLSEFDDVKPKPLAAVMMVKDFAGAISPTVIPDSRNTSSIPPQFPSALASTIDGPVPALVDSPNSSGRRTGLAEWIGRPDNPLTTRLIVNRIWQQHFGQGIVSSPNDFGHLGTLPTHPELLDWLTTTFVENGWSMKALHRRILMSSLWRQSSNHPRAVEYRAIDPAETMLWRAKVRRLKAEQVRDAMLAISGELDDTLGGASVKADTPRRGLYVKRMRNSPDPLLHAFDTANGLTSIPKRSETTTPLQALLLLNGDFALGRAQQFAARLKAREGTTPADVLADAFVLTWGRKPSEVELARAVAFVVNNDGALANDRLVDFCHVLFNSNEFLYVD